MRGETLGVKRRRFWRDEDKLKIVMAVGIGGVTVTRQQIYAWRQDLKKKGLWSPNAGVLFFPLDIPVAVTQPTVAETPTPSAIELRLRCGRCLHFDRTIDPTALTSLIRAVEAA
ncbi:transposase [Roseovarius sp. M141]|uniref:transposase n=1 Tax=Roseovarius sp. M141 TaxID=2583806 RepID=UPI0020CDFD30|nr:transposase [Roseovarius sp. M141]